MASNSEKLYEALKGFQDSRKAITDAYDTKMKQMESTKGSEYYQSESNKAKNEMNVSLKNTREEYGAEIDGILADMKAVNESRKMIAPSAEQLNLINALKMRDTVSLDELTEAANTCESCPVALSVINDIARQNGYLERFKGVVNEISVDDAKKEIQAILKGVQDFLQYDTSEASRVYADYVGRHYAINQETNKRPLFDNKEDCFKEVTGLSGDDLEAFEKAVDGTDAK